MNKTYIGLADCHGIESMQLKEDTSSQDRMMRMMRANANRQRHAVYFEADLDNPAEKIITEALRRGNCSMALEVLKQMSVELRSEEKYTNSWELIPNPKLDPYG
tara:strand:+ start:243 stop:554 length:312 start_codon:yes stop_codon:yes gene_type:complete